jgi:hypothetical protein
VKSAAVAPNGHLFLAGSTGAGLPVANAIQADYGGSADAFLAEFDPAGALVSSTYLGGAGNEEIDSLQVLADGSILAVGTSAPGPVVPLLFGSPNAMLWRIAP